MPGKKDKLTQFELEVRWETEEGGLFREEIIRQLQSKAHYVNWENLKVNKEDGTEVQWNDFPGVRESKGWIQIYNPKEFFDNEVLKRQYWNNYLGDLRGIYFKDQNLANANLDFTHLNHANLWNTNLESANLELARLAHTFMYFSILKNTNLEGANLEKADLSNADLTDANLFRSNLKNANLFKSILFGTDLSFSNLKEADLTTNDFRIKTFIQRINGAIKILIKYKDKPIKKISSLFSIKKLIHISYAFIFLLVLKLHIIPKNNFLKPTLLHGTKLRNANMQAYPVLFRNLLDEQYLEDFCLRHKYLYFFWLLTSNCGRSICLLVIWSVFFALCFGLVYANLYSPSWFPGWMQGFLAMIDPKFQGIEVGTRLWKSIYMSFVTMTTLGWSSVQPENTAGYWWHTAQNLFGYMWLGYLIAVLGSKLTRRSG